MSVNYVSVKSLELAYAAIESVQQELCAKDESSYNEAEKSFMSSVASVLKEIDQQIRIEERLIEMRQKNETLWDAKTEAENVVLDDVSLLYDEALKLDNAKDLSILRKDVSDAIKARDAYFDAVQE
jgi:hypothetical protein